MIKLESTQVVGWEAAIRGMRNPMNSWEKSDSLFFDGDEYHDICENSGPCTEHEEGFDLGWADHELMMKLVKGGPVHAKFRRMIAVYVDITAPLYWWKEFDTYKVGTVANSCSTMHKIAAKEFTLEDFSHEHLIGMEALLPTESNPYPSLLVDFSDEKCPNASYRIASKGILIEMINMLNECRKWYIELSEKLKNVEKPEDIQCLTQQKKHVWWQMIQLLPTSYNQRRTVMLNYEVLAGIYPMRKDHKLDEWHEFCHWIESLPHSEVIVPKE